MLSSLPDFASSRVVPDVKTKKKPLSGDSDLPKGMSTGGIEKKRVTSSSNR
jgi:hypothetical protein